LDSSRRVPLPIPPALPFLFRFESIAPISRRWPVDLPILTAKNIAPSSSGPTAPFDPLTSRAMLGTVFLAPLPLPSPIHRKVSKTMRVYSSFDSFWFQSAVFAHNVCGHYPTLAHQDRNAFLTFGFFFLQRFLSGGFFPMRRRRPFADLHLFCDGTSLPPCKSLADELHRFFS